MLIQSTEKCVGGRKGGNAFVFMPACVCARVRVCGYAYVCVLSFVYGKLTSADVLVVNFVDIHGHALYNCACRQYTSCRVGLM